MQKTESKAEPNTAETLRRCLKTKEDIEFSSSDDEDGFVRKSISWVLNVFF